jgi:hypothetical protein
MDLIHTGREKFLQAGGPGLIIGHPVTESGGPTEDKDVESTRVRGPRPLVLDHAEPVLIDVDPLAGAAPFLELCERLVGEWPHCFSPELLGVVESVLSPKDDEQRGVQEYEQDEGVQQDKHRGAVKLCAVMEELPHPLRDHPQG